MFTPPPHKSLTSAGRQLDPMNIAAFHQIHEAVDRHEKEITDLERKLDAMLNTLSKLRVSEMSVKREETAPISHHKSREGRSEPPPRFKFHSPISDGTRPISDLNGTLRVRDVDCHLPRVCLSKLRQTSTVTEYYLNFETLAYLTPRFHDSHLSHIFFSGLNDDIRGELLLRGVTATMPRADLARLVEEWLQSRRCQGQHIDNHECRSKPLDRYKLTEPRSSINAERQFRDVDARDLSKLCRRQIAVCEHLSVIPEATPHIDLTHPVMLAEERLRPWHHPPQQICIDTQWRATIFFLEQKSDILTLPATVDKSQASIINTEPVKIRDDEGTSWQLDMIPVLSSVAMDRSSDAIPFRAYLNPQLRALVLPNSNSNRYSANSKALYSSLMPQMIETREVFNIASGGSTHYKMKGNKSTLILQGHSNHGNSFVMQSGCYVVMLGVHWLQIFSDVFGSIMKAQQQFLMSYEPPPVPVAIPPDLIYLLNRFSSCFLEPTQHKEIAKRMDCDFSAEKFLSKTETEKCDLYHKQSISEDHEA